MLYHRLLPVVEPPLDLSQYAYRRDGGTEARIIELADFAHRALLKGHYCYKISFGLKGLFDNVSYHQLTKGLLNIGVDGHARRIIRNWLRTRSFRIRTRSQTGRCFSGTYPDLLGTPVGGPYCRHCRGTSAGGRSSSTQLSPFCGGDDPTSL